MGIHENYLDQNRIENFHEFMLLFTDIFTNNMFTTIKDSTYHNLKDIVRDKNVMLLYGDKDSGVVVMNRTDYSSNMQKMIDDGIKNKMYEETTDNSLKDLKMFKSFCIETLKIIKIMMV